MYNDSVIIKTVKEIKQTEVEKMWWIINAEHEPVFTVESKEEAEQIIEDDDWYIDYVYIK